MLRVLRFAVLLVGLALALAQSLAAMKPAIVPPGVRGRATASDSSRLAAAGEFYQRACARCHGEDRTGGEARDANPEIPDFTKKSWQTNRTDVQLLVSILDGKGRHMPSFRERLDTELARQLVAYIRDAGPPRPAPAVAPDDFARRFAELTSELEDLRTEFRRLMSSEAKPGAKTHKAPMQAPK